MKEFKIETTDQLLSLMNLYFSEWTHRDSIMWKQIFTFFFAIFVIVLLPFANIWDVALVGPLPAVLFPIVGFVLTLIFLYVSIGYARRLSKIGESYRELIEHLPREYQRNSIYKKEKITRRKQLSYTIPIIMFICLILFEIVIFVLCLI